MSSILAFAFQAFQALPDPNVLYSAIIQASAAIVAIIGGFITSTVLRRVTEQEALVSQIEDAESQIAALEDERQKLTVEIQKTRIEFRVHSVLGKLLYEKMYLRMILLIHLDSHISQLM